MLPNSSEGHTQSQAWVGRKRTVHFGQSACWSGRFCHASRQVGAAGGMGSSFEACRGMTTGADRDGLRRLWLGGGDRAARSDSTRLSSVPVPGLRQTVQRAQRRCPQSSVVAERHHAFVVFCRLRYRLTLRDLSEIILLRGFTVSHKSIRRWEAKLLPVMGEALRKRRHGIGRSSGQSWYADERPQGPWPLVIPVSGDRSRREPHRHDAERDP
jgi:hypothetical protein